jgi:tetratricopeptide (TPR) repeat protein
MKKCLAITFFSICLILLLGVNAQSESLFEKGMKEFKAENYEEALDLFQQARKEDPKSSTAAFYLGLTYKIQENYKDSIPPLRDAVTLTPRIKEAVVELADSLYQTDNFKETLEWIAVGEREGIQPAKLQFLKGLTLAKEGKSAEAVQAFEKAKGLDGSLAQAVEFQIASAYVKDGRLKEARNRFQAAAMVDPKSDIAAFARDYEKIIDEKMERERPWRLSVGMGLKYDTNVVAKGSGPQVDEISGHQDYAANLSFRVGYTAPFSFNTPFNLNMQYSLFAERYFNKSYTRADGSQGNLNEYNTATNVISLTPGYNFSRYALTLPISYAFTSLQGDKTYDFLRDANWFWDTRYMQSFSATPTLRFMIGQNHIGEVSFGYMKKKYYDTDIHPEAIDERENRDGETFSGGLGWMYLFKEGKGLFTLRYTYSDEKTDGDNWSNQEHRFSSTFLYPLAAKWKLQLSGDAAFADYVHTNAVFDTRRTDEVYNGSVALIYEVFKNVDVLLQYTYIRDKCNISIYDYERMVYTLGFEYRY